MGHGWCSCVRLTPRPPSYFIFFKKQNLKTSYSTNKRQKGLKKKLLGYFWIQKYWKNSDLLRYYHCWCNDINRDSSGDWCRTMLVSTRAFGEFRPTWSRPSGIDTLCQSCLLLTEMFADLVAVRSWNASQALTAYTESKFESKQVGSLFSLIFNAAPNRSHINKHGHTKDRDKTQSVARGWVKADIS